METPLRVQVEWPIDGIPIRKMLVRVSRIASREVKITEHDVHSSSGVRNACTLALPVSTTFVGTSSAAYQHVSDDARRIPGKWSGNVRQKAPTGNNVGGRGRNKWQIDATIIYVDPLQPIPLLVEGDAACLC